MSPEDPILSDHGTRRGKERAGLDRRALERTAGRALSEGLDPQETSGSLRRYLDKLSAVHRKTLRVLGNHIFVFGSRRVLVTVLELPHEFRRAAASALKKRS